MLIINKTKKQSVIISFYSEHYQLVAENEILLNEIHEIQQLEKKEPIVELFAHVLKLFMLIIYFLKKKEKNF